MIDPEQIPQFTGDLDQLEADIADLKGDGTAVEKTGTDTNSTFQGLSAYYAAPEADQLFATTKPVATAGTTFHDDLAKVTAALTAYAAEVRPLAARLASLKSQASAFTASVAHDKDWQYDGDKVSKANGFRTDVDAAVAAFWEAERRCANAIEAVFGGTRFTANDGTNASTMYGYSAKQLDGAKGLPWGDPVEQKFHWYNLGHWGWSFIKGFFVDGLWGTIKGLGGLVGFQGWDKLVASWKGLGKLGIGLAVMQVTGPAIFAVPKKDLPGWLSSSLDTTKAAGKAMVCWDEWSKDPARAAGGLTFNVLTAVASDGAGDGVEAAGDAGKVSAAARAMGALSKAGRFVDPMTYVGKGAGKVLGTLGKIPKVSVALDGLSKLKTVSLGKLGDHVGNLRDSLTGGMPKIPTDDLHVPAGDGHIPGELTAGPDGTIHLPDGSRLTPDGNYHLPSGETTTVPSEDLTHSPAGELHTPGDGPLVHDPNLPGGGEHVPGEVPAPRELVGVHAGAHDGLPGTGDPAHDLGGTAGHGPHAELGTHPRGDGTPAGTTATHTGHTGGTGEHTPATGHDGGGHGGGGHGSGGHGGGGHGGGGHGGGAGGGHDGLGPADDAPQGTHDGNDPAADAARHRAEYEAARAKPADERTPAERAAITREHVRLANHDPAWRAQHYDKWGPGKRNSVDGQADGQLLPQIAQDSDGNWIATHDMPHGPAEIRFNPNPHGPETVPEHSRPHLDDTARNRRLSVDLLNAERKFDDAPTQAHQDALSAARDAYDKHLAGVPNNSSHSERLGESAARHHVIPTQYADAERIHLPKTPNGANMFDDVYKLPKDGHYLIVEEKAPSGDLDWRHGKADPDPLNPTAHDGGALGMRVKQGTRPYIRTILAEMTGRGGKDAEIAAKLRAALRDGKLQYVLVKAVDNPGSTYAGAVMEEFKI